MNRIVITREQKEEEKIRLNREQEHYLKRVLRLREGDRFIALDGEGDGWLVELKEGFGEIVEPCLWSTELPVKVTLVVALPKGNGFEEVIRQCTEIGVNSLMPVISDHTLNQPSKQKWERWQKIAKEAAEQSERQIVPKIREPEALKKVLAEFNREETDGYFCVTRKEVKHLQHYLGRHKQAKEIMIVTGPEGGWSMTEIEQANGCGLEPVSLGHRILRAVTAPMVALSLVAASVET